MRVIKSYESFFTQLFANIIESGLIPQDVIVDIVNIPSVMLNQIPDELVKEAIKVSRKYGMQQETQNDVASILMLYLSSYLAYFQEHKRLPPKERRLLSLFYAALKRDIADSRVPSIAEVEKLKGEKLDFDAVSTKLNPRVAFLIDRLIKGTDYDVLNRLQNEYDKRVLELERDKRERESPLLPALTYIATFVESTRIDTNRELLDFALKRFNVPPEQIANALSFGFDSGTGNIVIRDKDLPILKFLMQMIQNLEARDVQILESLKNCKKDLVSTANQYVSVMKMLLAQHAGVEIEYQKMKTENERLRDALRQLRTQAGAPQLPEQSERLAEKVIELEAEVERVSDERDYYLELVEAFEPAVVASKKKDKLPSEISYFGMPNPQLEQILEGKYKISVKIYPATELPTAEPPKPVFFNPQVASHKVWYAIRKHSPRIVVGANAEIIANQIMQYLEQ